MPMKGQKMFDLSAEIAKVSAEADSKSGTIYVDYRDELNEEQVGHLVTGNLYYLYDSLVEYAGDAYYARYGGPSAFDYELGNLSWSDEFLAALEEWNENENGEEGIPGDPGDLGVLIDQYLEENDYSSFEVGPSYDIDQLIGDLARNTSSPLMTTTLSYYSDFEGSALDDDEMFDAKVEYVKKSAAKAGLTLDEDVLYDIVANGPHDMHEGVAVELLYTVDLEALYASGFGPKSVSISNPTVALLDRWNGSGWAEEVPGTASFNSDKFEMELDSAVGYGWQEIAGVSPDGHSEAVIS